VNHKVAFNRFDGPDAMMKADPKGSPVIVNGHKIDPARGEFRVKQGENVEVDNKLYVFTNEKKFALVSNDAAKTRELFPNGIHDIKSQQGQIGDCAKLAQLRSLMDDSSGVGSKAVLDTMKRNKDGSYTVTMANGFHTRIPVVKDPVTGQLRVPQKAGESQSASGDLGFQILERAHYRQIRREAKGTDEVGYINQSGQLQRSDTLAKRNTDLDNEWSSDFAHKLVGERSGYQKFTFDGSGHTDGALQKGSWSQGVTLHDRMADPNISPAQRHYQQQQVDGMLNQLEKDPTLFRGVAVSKFTNGDDTVMLPLSNGQQLYGNHAYSFQGISRDAQGNRVFHLVNPHQTDKDIVGPERNLSEKDFFNNFSMVDGVMRQPSAAVKPEPVSNYASSGYTHGQSNYSNYSDPYGHGKSMSDYQYQQQGITAY